MVIRATLEHTPRSNPQNEDNQIYDFKTRWLQGRLIPSSYIHEVKEGGYEIKSQERGNKTTYRVSKSVHGKWICSCHDFALYSLPCKHCIKIALYVNMIPDEKTKQAKMIEQLLQNFGQPMEFDPSE